MTGCPSKVAVPSMWVMVAMAASLALTVAKVPPQVPLLPSSCNPLVCACAEDLAAANCTGKGFLRMPTGLPMSLQQLDLSQNELEAVNTTELARLTDLRQLDLSHNLLSGLAAGVHYTLEVLDLSFNNITSVRSLHLDGLISLEELNLAHNRIINLPPNAFSTSPHLRVLNLRSNKVVSLEPGSLDRLSTLEELNLTKNRLSSIPKGLFAHMRNLRVLELNKNRFIEIVGLTFHGLDNLRVLKLKRNQIEYLTDGAFFGLSNIEELHLDRNRVNAVEKGWLYGLTTLRVLSLSDNRIDYIADDGWEFCYSLTDLDLGSNRLQLLDRDSLRMLPQLRRLHLQDNIISHIEDDDVFAEVPMLEALALDGNEISHTIEDMASPFRGLSRLRKLTLRRNLIKSVGEEAFGGGLDSIEEIDLRGNVISTVQENAFVSLPLLGYVRLNSSSILCDCYLKWLPRWLNETGVTGCDLATCAHPENLKGRSIMQVPYESYTCDDFPKPYILQQPQTQITLKGSNLTLFCRAASTSPAEMRFEWKLDSEVVEYGACVPEDNRDRCIHDVAHSFDGKGREITSELRLTNLEYDDAGRYQCIVSNRFGATYSDRANITVYVYPQFVVTPEDITVRGGQTAALKCAASGVPAPKVSWSKDSGDFPAATEKRIAVSSFAAGEDRRTRVNSFVIYSVTGKDMGVYRCTAANPAGSISWNITLSVLEVPRFVKPMESKTVPLGDTAVIECMASGSPKPRLTWTKDGGKLEATERHFFTADNQLLIIVKAMESDAGRYECAMHNQLGMESQSSVLAVSDSVFVGSDSEGGSTDFFPEQTWIVVLIAVLFFVAFALVLWACCVYCARRRRRGPGGRGGPGGHAASQPAHQFEVQFKTGGGSKGGAFRPPNVMNISGSAGEGEFDIGRHIQQNLMASRMNRTPVGSDDGSTKRDPKSGVLTTDLKKLPTAEEPYDERDSGTGDSKKSNDAEYEEGIPLMMEGDNALFPQRSISNPIPPSSPSPLLPGEQPSPELLVQVRHGGGESRMSMTEFGDIPFVEDDDEEGDESGPGSVVSGSSSDDQGGGEGQCDAEAAVAIVDSSSSSSSSSKDLDTTTATSNTAKSESSKAAVNGETPAASAAFRTFHPRGRRQRQISEVVMNNASCADLVGAMQSAAAVMSPMKKRASTVELNGECYLAIEPEARDARTARDPLEPCVYRGGAGTVPRNRLAYEEALLEASLNGTREMEEEEARQEASSAALIRKSESRTSLFGKKGKNRKGRDSRGHSLPRGDSVIFHRQYSSNRVAERGKEMF